MRNLQLKKLVASTVVAVAMVAALTPAAQAATVAGNFNVTVTLTSVCTMATIGDLAFGTYVAFQATAKTATATTATLTCTRGLAGVIANFDTTAGIGSTGAAAATNAVGAGVISGLQYDITATAGVVVAGTAASSVSIGTADSRPYSITGSMPALQPGTCTTTSCAATQLRTLTVTY